MLDVFWPDAIYCLIIAGFFAFAWWLTKACERL